MPNLEIINNALNSDIDDKNLNIDENKQLLGNQTEQIIEQLNQWIENKGYIIQGLTINTLSLELRINKTYLSAHINNKYKMTFREWINSLRIEYAKEIMTEDPTRINDEIAKLAGYTSRTHFIKVFTDLEGQSPSNWKNNNICQIQKTLP